MNWSQRWLDCLFLHFPAPAEAVARHLPPRLEVETFGGSAWISYVLFRLKLRPAWLPPVLGFSSLFELNIRTYVRHRGQSGIYFLRMLADNRLAIAAARLLTPLPYEHARMSYAAGRAECCPFRAAGSRLVVQFQRPTSFAAAGPGSLDDWLLERYRLFLGGPDSAVLAADVEHPPWQAAPLASTVVENSIAIDCGVAANAQPAIAHYSPGVAARFGAIRTVAAAFSRRGNETATGSRRYVTPAHAGARCAGR